jgi:hypothetical protein
MSFFCVDCPFSCIIPFCIASVVGRFFPLFCLLVFSEWRTPHDRDEVMNTTSRLNPPLLAFCCLFPDGIDFEGSSFFLGLFPVGGTDASSCGMKCDRFSGCEWWSGACVGTGFIRRLKSAFMPHLLYYVPVSLWLC